MTARTTRKKRGTVFGRRKKKLDKFRKKKKEKPRGSNRLERPLLKSSPL